MNYRTNTKPIEQFNFVSTNQHGDRYKQVQPKYIHAVTLSAKSDNAVELLDLVVLSEELNVPVHYDFDKQKAFMTLVSAEAI